MPKIERFCGHIDIAHGGFHLLPATSCPRKLVTVFDLSAVRQESSRTTTNIALHLQMLRHSAKHATALVAISESCKRDIVEIMGVAPERVFVVPGGVRTEEFDGVQDENRLSELRKKFGIARPYFLYLSTLEPRKNMPRLIEAYARVLQRHPDTPQLVLAGRKGWMYGDIFSTATRLGLGANVIFTDYLSRENAVALLKGAYACTYPSLYEGFGLPILEAMAARVPVMTSNVSSMPEVAGDAALLVDPESVDALEAGLESLVTHYDAALAKVEAGYARAKTTSWEASADALAGVYRNVMENYP